MKPKIDSTSFGSITVDGETFEYDILIRLNGQVEKREKALSKELYGTSHKVSLEEAKYIYEEGNRKNHHRNRADRFCETFGGS